MISSKQTATALALLAIGAGLGYFALRTWHELVDAHLQRPPSAGPSAQMQVQARAARIALTEYYVAHNRFPVAGVDADFPPLEPGTRITGYGVVEMEMAGPGSPHLFLVPHVSATGIRWECIASGPQSAPLPRDCRYVAGYAPPSPGPAETAAATLRQEIELQTREGTRFTMNAGQHFMSPHFAELTQPDQARVLDIVLARDAGKLEEFGELLRFGDRLVYGGPRVVPALRAYLPQAPANVAAGIVLAICRIGDDYNGTLHTRIEWPVAECFPALAATAPHALAYLARVAQQTLDHPQAEPYNADVYAAGIAGALGAAGRPAVPGLARLLVADDHRPDAAGKRSAASRALLAILLGGPRDDEDEALVAKAIGVVAQDAFRSTGNSRMVQGEQLKPSGLAAALDRYRLTDRGARELARVATRLGAQCQSPSSGEGMLELGLLGIRLMVETIDGADDECLSTSNFTSALALLGARYPATFAQEYERAQTVLARDTLTGSALAALDPAAPLPLTPKARAGLRGLLARTGYVPVTIVNGMPRFPPASGLAWHPLPAWDLPAHSEAEPMVTYAYLRQLLAGLAAAFPECQVPTDDATLQAHSGHAKSLFVVPCERQERGPLLLIVSATGAKTMHVPERLRSLVSGEDAAIVGVSDLEGAGNLAILTRRQDVECENALPRGGDPARCDIYAFGVEDGVWFTYPRRH